MAIMWAISFTLSFGVSLAGFPAPSSLPPHSWDTVGHKVFMHGCKAEGPLNESEVALASRFSVLTVEKGQGLYLEGYAEEKMAAVSKQYKAARPDGRTIFYMNSIFDWAFYRMHDTMLENLDYAIINPATGEVCRKHGDSTFPQNPFGMLVFNVSNPGMRKMFVDECKNAIKDGFDGCFVDGANVWTNCIETLSPGCSEVGFDVPCNLTITDFEALGLGQRTLLMELQEAVTTDGIIIPKDVPNYDDGRYVDAMFPDDTFCSCYNCAWTEKEIETCRSHLNISMETVARGQLAFLHGELNSHPDAPSEEEQFTFTLAAFLITAEESSFFAFSDWWYYNGTKWHDEYERPLKAPKGLATLDTAGIWRREFEAGVTVILDVAGHNATIDWGS